MVRLLTEGRYPGRFVADSALCQRVLAEYREMPGLRLSARQAARLWGLEQRDCEDLLQALVSEGRLARSARGEYCSCADAEWGKRPRLLGFRGVPR